MNETSSPTLLAACSSAAFGCTLQLPRAAAAGAAPPKPDHRTTLADLEAYVNNGARQTQRGQPRLDERRPGPGP